jgi:[ribosomal protein S18]-alanine N-acetyltransferase
MSDRPRLRDARPADLPALLALEALFPGDRLSPRQMRRHLASGLHPFRVAEDAERLLGYALVFLRRGSDLARLYSLVVAPAARGRGLGLLLLRDAEDAARAAGRHRMRLEVREDNPAAIALYRAAGYREGNPRPGYYDDGAAARRFWRALAAQPG